MRTGGPFRCGSVTTLTRVSCKVFGHVFKLNCTPIKHLASNMCCVVFQGGDQPLFGKNQPPVRSSETQRREQAAIVANFVNQTLAIDPAANIVVLGDINDFQFSEVVEVCHGWLQIVTLCSCLSGSYWHLPLFNCNMQLAHSMVYIDHL